MASPYMEWAKLYTDLPFNLANSGLQSYPLSKLHFDPSTLQLSGPGQYGYEPLKQAIGKRYRVEPECIVTAQGTSMANYLAMAALVGPGDEVLVEYPGYPLLWETAEHLDATVKLFKREPANGFAIDFEELRERITNRTRLIAVTNLHNPGCTYLDNGALRLLGEIADECGARVLVDEVYLDVLFDQRPSTSFHLGTQFVVTSSLTKAYGLSGLRCGWIFAEEWLTRRIYRINDFYGVNEPFLTDQLSVAAFAQLDEIAAWSKEILDGNRALANAFLARASGLEPVPRSAGTVLFPKVVNGADKLCQLLREKYKTAITPGHFFGEADRVRIGLGGESAVVAEGLERVRLALDEL